MTDRGAYDGTAVKRVRTEEKLYDDFEIEEYGQEDEEITVYDVDTVLGYSVDILKLGMYLLLGALVTGVIYLVFQYL